MLPELNSSGYLEIFIGPMFAGKTSKILELYKKYSLCDINTTIINYIEDTRYDDSLVSTHDLHKAPCLQLKNLFDLKFDNHQFISTQVFLINEGQFFDDILKWVREAIETHKKVIFICGLDGDYKRNKFGNLLDLIPLCDNVTKLTAYCMKCKNSPAIFSQRITNEKEQKLIHSDKYMPVCRKCYIIL